MKIRRSKITSLVLMLIALTLFVAPIRTQAAKKSVYISLSVKNNTAYVVGDKKTMKVTTKAKSSAKSTLKTTVTFKSASTKIATISSKGVITAKSPGKVKITVTAKPKNTKTYKTTTKSITIQVKPKKASVSSAEYDGSKIKVTTSKVSGATGYEYQYAKNSAMTSSPKSVKKTDTSYSFTAGNASYYVRVRAYATLKDSAKKSYTLYGAWSSVKGVVDKSYLVKSITFDASSMTYTKGDSYDDEEIGEMEFLTVLKSGEEDDWIDYSDGHTYSVKSSDNKIARPYIDEDEVGNRVFFEAFKNGTCTITLNIDGVSKSFSLTVDGFSEEDTTPYFDPGNDYTIAYPTTISEDYSDSRYAVVLHVFTFGETAKWTASDTSIVTLGKYHSNNSYVTVTPHKTGQVTLTCTVGDTTLEKTVTVVEPPKVQSIDFDIVNNHMEVEQGSTTDIAFTTTLADGTTDDYYDEKYYAATVKSSDETVATVDFDTDSGLTIEAKQVGVCNITLRIGTKEVTFGIRVKEKSEIIIIDGDNTEATEGTTSTINPENENIVILN